MRKGLLIVSAQEPTAATVVFLVPAAVPVGAAPGAGTERPADPVPVDPAPMSPAPAGRSRPSGV